jgi:hypothetical protein
MPPRRETAPASVAIVREVRDFSPACCPSPKSPRIGENGSRNWPHLRRETIHHDIGAGESADHRPPSHRTELDGGDPARRCLVSLRHHRGAQRPAPPGTTMLAHCHKPSPVGPPRPRWEKVGLELAAATAGAPPPTSPSRARRWTSAAPRRRVTAPKHAAAARKGATTVRGRRPRRRRRCPGFTRWVFRQRRGGGEEGEGRCGPAEESPPVSVVNCH